MKKLTNLKSVLHLLIALISSESVYAGSISLSGFQMEPKLEVSDFDRTITPEGDLQVLMPGDNLVQLISPVVNISVSGNLYLDFSVFSEYNAFAPAGLVSFNADRINIFPANRTPEIDNQDNWNFFHSVPVTMAHFGDALMFSDMPILDGNFTATENIYIGDYSQMLAVQAVPVPAAVWFFVSGLTVLFSRKFKRG